MLLLSPCSAEHNQAFTIMYHIEECTVCSKVLLVAVSMIINASLTKYKKFTGDRADYHYVGVKLKNEH